MVGPRPHLALTLRHPRELLAHRRDVQVSPDGPGLIRAALGYPGKGRPVSLLPEAAAALKAHRSRYLAERVRRAEAWKASWERLPKHRDLVFPSTAGTAIGHTNLNRQHLQPILKRAGLPHMRPYDLRHSFATLWLEMGESSEALQKILGHSSIKTTIDSYAQPPLSEGVHGTLRRGARAPVVLKPRSNEW